VPQQGFDLGLVEKKKAFKVSRVSALQVSRFQSFKVEAQQLKPWLASRLPS
jgi:hypothetical protein